MTKATDDSRRLRVLVLTNHLKWFAGSELVALEVARGFAALGDDVTVAANIISAPLADETTGLSLTDDVATVDFCAFDLVWCQHDVLSLLPRSAFEKASQEGLPHVACVSLSPFEPYEHLNGVLAKALSADIYANSAETAEAIAKANAGVIDRRSINVFHNAAPDLFWRSPASAPSAQLRSILFVSNHPPEELIACASLLESKGVAVRRLGMGSDHRLLKVQDLEAADALVTIGKSVSYAIAMKKPVFIYDRFGGDGWLTRDNFESNRHFNFSGRPDGRRLDPVALTAEIIDGYAAAAAQCVNLGDAFDLSAFRLEHHLGALRRRALGCKSGLGGHYRRLKLSHLLAQPMFRAQLETSRRKAELMRFMHRQIELPPG